MTSTKKKNIEIELKILVQDEAVFKQYLEENTTFEKEESLEDIYFENPDYPFLYINENGLKDAKEWLRVRKSESGDTINYKHVVDDEEGKTIYLEETETKVDSGDEMIQILKSLGFVASCHYHKMRRVYRDKTFEFDVDFIDALGMVVEIEYQGEITEPEKGILLIRSFLKEKGITEYTELRTGYPQILWNGIDCYL